MSPRAQEMLAYSGLLLVVAGLVIAALYAVFGKPDSDAGKKSKRHVINGFQIGAGIILGFFLICGLIVADDVLIFDVPSRFSKPLAFVIGGCSLGVIALTVQRWGKYLAGWVGYGIVPALFAASSGYIYGHAIRRSDALSVAALSLVTVLTSFRFTEGYKLNIPEKLALILWVLAFVVGADHEHYTFPALAIGTGGLTLAWFYSNSRVRSLWHRRVRA